MSFVNEDIFAGYMSSQNNFIQEVPPVNPRSGYYQGVCFVCKEVAKPDEPHSLHYGGVVCLSCRAFFRRAHQKTRHPYFLCKRGDSCDITVATRRRCQRCRYIRCLAAGMNPNAVLTDEEKVVRFRKTILKRLKTMEEPSNESRRRISEDGESNEGDVERSAVFDVEDFESLESTINTIDLQLGTTLGKIDEALSTKFDEEFFFPSSSTDLDLPSSSSNGNMDSDTIQNASTNSTKQIANLVQSICHSYHYIANADHLINTFFSKIHANFNNVHQELTTLQKQLCEQFIVFAKSQHNFSKLSETDQTTLLSRNTQLFGPFSFACCISTLNGDPDLELDFYDPLFLESNQAHKVQSISKIFRSDTNLAHLDQLMRAFTTIVGADSVKLRAILTYLIIFARDETTLIYDEILMREIELENSKLSETILADKNLPSNWIEILREMSSLCERSFAWEEFYQAQSLCGPGSVTIKFTNDEDLWLKNQLKKLDEAHKSVPFGEEITNEFMMYTLEVPVSKRFIKAVFDVALERMKRIFKFHLEFQALPLEKQMEMMNLNCVSGLALTVARYEAVTTGTSQILESLGGSEERTWTENYQPILNSKSKVKKITMKDLASQKAVSLSKEQLERFGQLTQDMSDIVADDELFKIIKLLALFKTCELQTSSEVQSLSNMYTLIVKRKIEDLFRSKDKVKSNIVRKFRNPQECYQQISMCLSHLKPLAEILIYIMNAK